MDNYMEVLQRARDAAKMHTIVGPLAEVDQWGLLFTDGRIVSFKELASTGYAIDAVVRVAGGFFEMRGAQISPNGREAAIGWNQPVTITAGVAHIALVVDHTEANPRFLIEFREEPFAIDLPGNVVASASAAASASNLTGEHGFKGAPQYIEILERLEPHHHMSTCSDMARDCKTEVVHILRWAAKPGLTLPDLTGKHYAWVTMAELTHIVHSGIASPHLLKATAIYCLS
ncbi:MAG: NDP-hexose 2,3-dehydratase family protein [Candidatus Kerfeldbacteria bacterium]|nr:NDP-hexose 2,3-dehydratase family protein [Candidatus Kerfeldbacteria bacterium]